MCGRLTLTQKELREVASLVGADAPDATMNARYKARYNIAPGQEHWIVVSHDGHRVIEPARFGLRSRRLKEGMAPINARSETVMKVGAFRESLLARRRAVVPADGFYEWSGPKTDRRPMRFTRHDGQLLLLAGLWSPDPRAAPGEEAEPGFAILTAEATGELAAFHDRVPVILAPEQVDAWLGAPSGSPEEKAALTALLASVPDGMLSWRPASKRVNKVANDDAACLEEDPPGPKNEGGEGQGEIAKAPARAQKKKGNDRQMTLF